MSDVLTNRRARKTVTASKAKEILTDGTVHGEPLTPRQKGYFGIIAGGGTPTRTQRTKRRRR